MEQQLAITNLKKVTSDDSIIVKGKVAPGARRFAINLGKNPSNILIHFNPRFARDGGPVIVCASKVDGNFKYETRFAEFPFREGEEVTIRFKFQGNEVKVQFPKEITFTSELSMNHIEFISVDGDFEVKSIHLE